MQRAALILFIAAFATLGSAALAADHARWKSVDYVVESFLEIALGSEHGVKKRHVRKWMTPVRYALIHHAGDAELHERMAGAHFTHLALLTGLTIRPAQPGETPNFSVVLTSEDRLRDDLKTYFGWDSSSQREQFFRETVCVATFASRRNGQIIRATAIIPVDRARSRGKLPACIVEELTQVLGLPNDSDKVFPSVFNDNSIDTTLSGLDVTLLRLLYDPRIRPGMDEATVRPLARAIAAEFAGAGVYERAEQDAAGGMAAFTP